MSAVEPNEYEKKLYQDIARRMGADVDKASRVGQLYTSSAGDLKRARITSDENAPRIPRGAYVYFKPRPTISIRPGTFVFAQIHGNLVVRRFLGMTITPGGVLVHLKADRASAPEAPMPETAVVGVLVKVKVGEDTYDPNKMGLWEKFRNHFTDFGTVTPLQKLRRLLGFLAPPRPDKPAGS
ncbi:MAG TPA: hypothetical protein VNO81_13150 [Candidatus Nitrosotenuis sp.]|jgi:hypothetical protein|nr:hypothetical protein [Candidatus Nitrosotenuis sp.]